MSTLGLSVLCLFTNIRNLTKKLKQEANYIISLNRYEPLYKLRAMQSPRGRGWGVEMSIYTPSDGEGMFDIARCITFLMTRDFLHTLHVTTTTTRTDLHTTHHTAPYFIHTII